MSCSRLEWPLAPHHGTLWEAQCSYSPPQEFNLEAQVSIDNSFFQSSSPQWPCPTMPSDLSHSALGFTISLCFSWGSHMTISSNRFQALQEHTLLPHRPLPPTTITHPASSSVHPRVATISRHSVRAARFWCSEDVHNGVSAALHATFNPFFTL